MICRNCSVVSDGKITSKSNGWVFFVLLFFMIVPAIIYALATSKKYKVCPTCGSHDIVPVTSPMGQQLFGRLHCAGENEL